MEENLKENENINFLGELSLEREEISHNYCNLPSHISFLKIYTPHISAKKEK